MLQIKEKLTFGLIVLFLAFSVSAEQPELPQPGEIFSSYFARITRGGTFPGIYLDMNQNIKESFLKRIKKGSWVGSVDRERKRLENVGVSLWQDWYKRENPGPLILASAENIHLAENLYKNMISNGAIHCPGVCPTYTELISSNWNTLESWKRELWIKNIVLYAPIFGAHTLLWHLSEQYELDEKIVLENVDVKILDHKNFVSAVYEMGYSGAVYFRGITGPDPKNPNRHWILLDDEFLRTRSPFENTLYKMMEVPGILIHELSHVCQDIEGTSLGYSIEVTSGEDALVIEGMAETYAEKAINQAGNSLKNINPWMLFAAEQGMELVFKEGNENSGTLFPYTVGLPFATSLLDLTNDRDQKKMRQKFLMFLDSTTLKNGKTKQTLTDWLMNLGF
jgi:hypothetical protein